MTVLTLSDAQVLETIQPRPFYEAVEAGLRDLAAGVAVSPKETMIAGPEEGLHYAYLGWLPRHGGVSVKFLHALPVNPERGLPFVQATVILADDRTGTLRAVMEARALTAFRTACASALASRYLTSAPPRVLAILGAGPQAFAHGVILPLERTYDEVRVWARRPSQALTLAGRLAARGVEGRAVSTLSEAVGDADVVVTATRARTPLFARCAVRAGALVCVVGPLRPWGCEVDLGLVRGAALFVDDRDKFVRLWEGVSDAPRPRRETLLDLLVQGGLDEGLSTRVVRVFKGVGLAIEDTAAAQWVWEARQEQAVTVKEE
jgi:ornithine cyclodeaminase/alanine dehydrogenase-like protein (mu-crystallin family)